MTIRKNVDVRVTYTIDGRKRVKMRPPTERRKVEKVNSRKIHNEVLTEALRIAGGDMLRLDWENATEEDGVIIEITVLNKPKGR